MTSMKYRLTQVMLGLGTVLGMGCANVEGFYENEVLAEVEQAETFDPNGMFRCPVDTSDVNYGREMVITALDVVNDPCRTGWNAAVCAKPSHVSKWTFGHLMQQVATADVNVSTLILKWLESFEEAQNVNGQTFIPRNSIRSTIIGPWRQAGKKPGSALPCSANGKVDSDPCDLDLTVAPFRLLAIVNRTDLRVPGYGGGAGEARFVFGFTKMDGTPLDGTVILEYALPTTLSAVQWANRFQALRAQSDPQKYNEALADLTDLFTRANANPSGPNGSALSQVRTAEKAFDSMQVFEMREQRLQCRPNTICSQTGKLLLPSTLALTPRNNLDSSPTLTSYMNNNMTAIVNGTHIVPTTMLATFSRPIDPAVNPFGVWMADAPLNSVPYPDTEGDVRRLFGFSTCNGCHSQAETKTNNFHISPRAANTPSTLSPFLSGAVTVVEPLEGETVQYNERDRRTCEYKWLYTGHTTLITTNAGRSH